MNHPEKIKKMFATISKDYDFLNHFLSFGFDNLWRKKVAAIIKEKQFKDVVDIACGTGDLTNEIAKKINRKVTGIDYCIEMVKIAKKKYPDLNFITGDATLLPVKKNSFDVVTIAFGIRNIPDRIKALNEFFKIIKKGGFLIILEFSNPKNFFMKFYFNNVLPFVGGLFSNREAYEYLPNSVKDFPEPEIFKEEIEAAGFKIVDIKSLNLGSVRVYVSEK